MLRITYEKRNTNCAVRHKSLVSSKRIFADLAFPNKGKLVLCLKIASATLRLSGRLIISLASWNSSIPFSRRISLFPAFITPPPPLFIDRSAKYDLICASIWPLILAIFLSSSISASGRPNLLPTSCIILPMPVATALPRSALVAALKIARWVSAIIFS